MERFAAPGGSANNEGTRLHPWSLEFALTKLEAGDTLSLLGGRYVGHFIAKDLDGSTGEITIQAADGELVTLEGRENDFFRVPNDLWEQQGNSDTWISRRTYPIADAPAADPDEGDPDDADPEESGVRGSFVGVDRYTRLIAYGTLEDLNANNELFGHCPDNEESPKGFTAVDHPDHPERPLPNPRRPWVYMGPGVFQAANGKLHIRLSHTHHNILNFTNYTGETDPRQVPLAIWTVTNPTFDIVNCASLRVRNLTIRYGNRSVRIGNSSGVRLDGLTIQAGPYGIKVGAGCDHLDITNCLVDGGLPPWFFRGDRKSTYFIGSIPCKAQPFGIPSAPILSRR